MRMKIVQVKNEKNLKNWGVNYLFKSIFHSVPVKNTTLSDGEIVFTNMPECFLKWD